MNINQELYNMIFKRKSFHLFRNIGNNSISVSDIESIVATYGDFVPLYPNIKTAIQIVPASKTTCKRGQQFCILLYSEKKDNYLQNIGYLGEQLELYLVSKYRNALVRYWKNRGTVIQRTRFCNYDCNIKNR